jgi:hypothetical protein
MLRRPGPCAQRGAWSVDKEIKENKMNIRSRIKQHPVASFIVLTLGLSFAAFLLPVPPEGAFAIIALVVMIPTIVGFALVTLMEGRRVPALFCWSHSAGAAAEVITSSPYHRFVIHFGSSVLALLTGAIPALKSTSPNAALVIIPIALLEEVAGVALRCAACSTSIRLSMPP